MKVIKKILLVIIALTSICSIYFVLTDNGTLFDTYICLAFIAMELYYFIEDFGF